MKMGTHDEFEYKLGFEEGVTKTCEVVAVALKEWDIPNYQRVLVAALIGRALDAAQIGAHGYNFMAIVTDEPLKWSEVDEQRYNDMLDVLPPMAWVDYGFLVGEPWDHHPIHGYPRFTAMLKYNGKFYEGTRPIGAHAWRTLDLSTVEENIQSEETEHG